VPVIITRASNNYGPCQFPEKVIPLFLTNAIDGIPVPLYGDGLHERDWLHVSDHCRAIDLLVEAGTSGEVYNVGGGNHVRNIDLTRRILQLLGRTDSLIQRVPDRPGHDRRYSLDTAKLRSLGWQPQISFDQGLSDTADWYRKNESWWRPIKEQDPRFTEYYRSQYGDSRR
jgi:dTDP-glucose 4,6-dehydratase